MLRDPLLLRRDRLRRRALQRPPRTAHQRRALREGATSLRRRARRLANACESIRTTSRAASGVVTATTTVTRRGCSSNAQSARAEASTTTSSAAANKTTTAPSRYAQIEQVEDAIADHYRTIRFAPRVRIQCEAAVHDALQDQTARRQTDARPNQRTHRQARPAREQPRRPRRRRHRSPRPRSANGCTESRTNERSSNSNSKAATTNSRSAPHSSTQR